MYFNFLNINKFSSNPFIYLLIQELININGRDFVEKPEVDHVARTVVDEIYGKTN